MNKEEFLAKRHKPTMSVQGMHSLFVGAVASRYLIDKLKETKPPKMTPMRELDAAIKDIRSKNSLVDSPILIMGWLANNIDRLIYEEKYLVVETYDAAKKTIVDNDVVVKTEGQLFFEKHFINL